MHFIWTAVWRFAKYSSLVGFVLWEMQEPQAGVIKAGCNGYGRRDKDRNRYLAGTSQAFQLVCIRWKRAPFPLTECTDSTGVLRMFILKNAFSALDVISFIFVERPRLAAMSCPGHRGPSLAASCLAVWQTPLYSFDKTEWDNNSVQPLSMACPTVHPYSGRWTDKQTDKQTGRRTELSALAFFASCLFRAAAYNSVWDLLHFIRLFTASCILKWILFSSFFSTGCRRLVTAWRRRRHL